MLGDLTGWHMIIILAVVLLLFGATKLPALSKSVAQSVRIFRTEMKSNKAEPAGPSTADAVQEQVEAPVTGATASPSTDAVLASTSIVRDR